MKYNAPSEISRIDSDLTDILIEAIISMSFKKN